MRFVLLLAAGAVFAACSYEMTVETKCYRDGELAYVQQTTANSSSSGFGTATSSSSTNYTYLADWYDPAKHAGQITCTSNSAGGWS